MIKKLFFGALSLSVLNSNSQVVPNVDWQAIKSDRSNISNVPSAIDANNNAYITGYMFVSPTNANANTVKYDPNGVELWTNSYDNGGFDNSKAIVIDGAGNSYVTGESDGAGTARDIVTVKIDPNGLQLWAIRYNGASNGNDVGNSIVLDASGNVFVTGYTTNMGGNRDYITIKYSASGVQQFAVIYAGAGNQNDEAVAIGFNSNRLYVTGTSVNVGGNSDLVTLRINPNTGATVWTKSENGTANNNDMAFALLPYNNDVVVVGQLNNTTTNNDYVTSYYNGNNGNTIWTKKYDFANSSDGATALTVDANGNFAVTGIVNNAGLYEYHTLLYNVGGVQQWVNKVPTNLPYASVNPQIAVDVIANHFYVCGQKLGVGSDIFVYQITPTGNKTWDEQLNGSQNGPDAAVDLVVNSSGIIFVAAQTLNSLAKYDYATIKISQTQVYFPIDLNNANQPFSKAHYFYPNVGEVRDLNNAPASGVLFSTKNTYPQQYILSNNNLAFLLAKLDTSKTNYPFQDTLARVDLEFKKGNPSTRPYAFEYKTDNVLNYFLTYISPNPVTNNKGASRIMIPNIYPNIDLHYYSNNAGLKMYFVVKPGGNPNSIEMNFNGATGSSLNGFNDLTINTSLGNFKFAKPQVYNVNMLMQTPVATGTVGWVNNGGNNYKIGTGTYNNSLPLIIQVNQGNVSIPTSSTNAGHSTYMGGVGNEIITNSKLDNSDYNHICGSTTSPNFPPGIGPWNPAQGQNLGNRDGFIAQVNNDIYWRTFVGDAGTDKCMDIEVDVNTHDVYVTGITTSSVFPILSKPGAFNKSNFVGPLNFNNITGNNKDDGFIFQVSGDGTTNKWCTYYGGSDYDYLSDIRFDSNMNLYVAGASTSTDLPVVASGGQYGQAFNVAQKLQDPLNGRIYDAIIMKFAANTNSLNWATYFGSDLNSGTTNVSDDNFTDLDFDAANNIYVVGNSGGINMPGSLNGLINNGNTTDGVVVKFNNNGQLLFSKHTQGNTINNAVKVNNNKVYMCGMNTYTMATVNSGANYFNGTYNNGGPANSGFNDGDYIIYDLSFNAIHASYLGGANNDAATDLQFDKFNNIFYICGGTKSANFPTFTPANCYFSNNNGKYDYFVTAFKDGFTNAIWSTQLGTPYEESDFGNSASMSVTHIPFAGPHNLYLTGVTTSTTGYLFLSPPTSAYLQPNSGGGYQDATYTKFDINPVAIIGIKEYNQDSSTFKVYPNPTVKYISLQSTDVDNKLVEYNVYNMLGQKVISGKLNENAEKTIDVSNLEAGSYIVNFNSAFKNFNAKFIKAN
jgi:hypothetical protein